MAKWLRERPFCISDLSQKPVDDVEMIFEQLVFHTRKFKQRHPFCLVGVVRAFHLVQAFASRRQFEQIGVGDGDEDKEEADEAPKLKFKSELNHTR